MLRKCLRALVCLDGLHDRLVTEQETSWSATMLICEGVHPMLLRGMSHEDVSNVRSNGGVEVVIIESLPQGMIENLFHTAAVA